MQGMYQAVCTRHRNKMNKTKTKTKQKQNKTKTKTKTKQKKRKINPRKLRRRAMRIPQHTQGKRPGLLPSTGEG